MELIKLRNKINFVAIALIKRKKENKKYNTDEINLFEVPMKNTQSCKKIWQVYKIYKWKDFLKTY